MSFEGEHRLEDAELDKAIVGGNPVGETETRRRQFPRQVGPPAP
ncbi:hypothetical protein PoMZ_13278 [Pyricularia oryzae]|uniref:Uncharacterized protein n=1 Tax=Pyricularia oryzae TaxID=318829 RepID=A0A4P7NUP2_PYROR|nr:hypothetical protein PoMZ_13278 [Pyricularia oryzae]